MRSGKPERFFFIPKGALTHHLVGTDSISLALPFGQSSLIPLFLLSPKSLATFRGPFRRWYFLRKPCAHLRAKSRLTAVALRNAPAGAVRGGCGFCGSLMDNATSTGLCCHCPRSWCAVNAHRIPSLQPTVFHQLPAQTCHWQLWLRL